MAHLVNEKGKHQKGVTSRTRHQKGVTSLPEIDAHYSDLRLVLLKKKCPHSPTDTSTPGSTHVDHRNVMHLTLPHLSRWPCVCPRTSALRPWAHTPPFWPNHSRLAHACSWSRNVANRRVSNGVGVWCFFHLTWNSLSLDRSHPRKRQRKTSGRIMNRVSPRCSRTWLALSAFGGGTEGGGGMMNSEKLGWVILC